MKTNKQITPFIIRHYYKSALASWLESIEPGLYQKYASNIQVQWSKTVLEWIGKYQSATPPYNLTQTYLITGAFEWDKTSQGGPFWYGIHCLWCGSDVSRRFYYDFMKTPY